MNHLNNVNDQKSHCGDHIVSVSNEFLTSVWNPIIALLSDYQICEILTHRHLWNSVDGDPQGSILTSDGMYDRVTAIFLSSSQQHQDIISIWKCLWLADQRWWYTSTSSLKISDKNNLCTNFSIGHCQFSCMQMQAKFLGEQICLSPIWNSVLSANY